MEESIESVWYHKGHKPTNTAEQRLGVWFGAFTAELDETRKLLGNNRYHNTRRLLRNACRNCKCDNQLSRFKLAANSTNALHSSRSKQSSSVPFQRLHAGLHQLSLTNKWACNWPQSHSGGVVGRVPCGVPVPRGEHLLLHAPSRVKQSQPAWPLQCCPLASGWS